MFKGTHKHPAGYFDRTLEAKGAIVNAATWKDYTFFYHMLSEVTSEDPDKEKLKHPAKTILSKVLK